MQSAKKATKIHELSLILNQMHPIIRDIQKGNLRRVPEIKTGYTVRVSQTVSEGNKERVQKFEGLVIKVSHGEGVEKTFTVRKIVEGIGVEKIFPFHAAGIVSIDVVKIAKVRRQKLYYMRKRSGKSARLSERHVTDEDRAAEEARLDALYAEAVQAEEKSKVEEEKVGVTEESTSEAMDSQEAQEAVEPNQELKDQPEAEIKEAA